jgi:hypothetical protein
MPLYFGHKNQKGLSVSPALQARKIDMLRAAPSDVNVIARPLVTQHGYTSYVSHLPAFMKACIEQKTITLNRTGYPAVFPLTECIPLENPPLVVDFNGPIPNKHTEVLSRIGFERIKMNRTENILRFPSVTFKDARAIKDTTPNLNTPSPANTINLSAFESWILVVRTISSLLRAHTYPAFRDGAHFVDEIVETVAELSVKRGAADILESAPKLGKGLSGQAFPQEISEEDVEMAAPSMEPTREIALSKAKPPSKSEKGWGTPAELPNASGLFFPYVPELCTFDNRTVPTLIEDYLFQALGDTSEKQLDRLDKIRSAWGLIAKTDAGNVMAHLCKVVRLALTSQGRAFPLIADNVYEGCILSGGRLFVGLNGQVFRPLPFEKLQEETGGYSMHGKVLQEVLDMMDGTVDLASITTMRRLRDAVLASQTSEEERDQIRRLAVHLHFPGDKFLAVNPQTITRVLNDLTSLEDQQDLDLPMHHSALMSRDRVLVALASFGYQAPSFMIDNCPKVPIKGNPPNTLVIRQKPLDLACVDWKKMMEDREIRNNPRNLSRANRDRSIVGNDKTQVWGKLSEIVRSVGGAEDAALGGEATYGGMEDDGLDDW